VYEENRGEAESCVADSMYRSLELIQESCDSDSWCSYILCVCIFECYAHESLYSFCHAISFMLCMNDFLLNV
jgi:hypothetical protein